jgi:hypothetical protein
MLFKILIKIKIKYKQVPVRSASPINNTGDNNAFTISFNA